MNLVFHAAAVGLHLLFNDRFLGHVSGGVHVVVEKRGNVLQRELPGVTQFRPLAFTGVAGYPGLILVTRHF